MSVSEVPKIWELHLNGGMSHSLPVKKIKDLFWKKLTFIFDLDGTLYLGKKVLPGARELLWTLESKQKNYFYLTNNSSRSESEYLKKLRAMAFPVSEERIVMSTHLLISELQKRKWKRIFLLGTPAMRQMLKRSGISHIEKNPQAVVVGFDKTLTYDKLERACRWVDGGCPYIVTHPDLFCPTEFGPEPDCGAFAKVIELVTKRPPYLVLGKPNPLMLGEISRRAPIQKKSAIIIGDRLTTDISMAEESGVDSILVLTGETKFRDLSPVHRKNLNILPSVKDLL